MFAKSFWEKLYILAAGPQYKFMSSSLIGGLEDFSIALPNSYSEPYHFPQGFYQLSASIALSRWPNSFLTEKTGACKQLPLLS